MSLSEQIIQTMVRMGSAVSTSIELAMLVVPLRPYTRNSWIHSLAQRLFEQSDAVKLCSIYPFKAPQYVVFMV